MDGDFGQFIGFLQGGGNVALGIAVYFIYKAANRLSRIEKMLEILLLRGHLKIIVPELSPEGDT